MYNPNIIYTNGKGVPFPRPEFPGPNATSEQVVKFLREWREAANAVTNGANDAFDLAFRRIIRATRKPKSKAKIPLTPSMGVLP